MLALTLSVSQETSYKGVSLGGRRHTQDIRDWIDRFGWLGHGAGSYDHWYLHDRHRDGHGHPDVQGL